MSNAMMIDTALRLPAPEVEALISGRSLVAMPLQCLEEGEYALCPDRPLIPTSSPSHYYKPDFLDLANTPEKPQVKAWAKCDRCELIDETEDLEKLSDLTLWTPATLREIIAERELIFLAYFRVYLLPEPLEVEAIDPDDEFIPLLSPISITTANPVFDDDSFRDRRERLLKRELSEHPELEALQTAIARSPHPAAQKLTTDLNIFMGISEVKKFSFNDPDLEWIQTIADVGNSSDGHTFEKLVRRSFIKLGFTNSSTNPKMSLDPEATGGAGGLDLYCEKPYPVIGECKATKTENVSDGTPSQLIKHGHNFLGKEEYENSVKIILAAGKLNSYARRTAEKNKMNVIRPETLQQLMELAANYPGSINLFRLKECLEKGNFGEAADNKVLKFIDDIKKAIKLRSHLVRIIKDCVKPEESAPLDFINGICHFPDNPEELKKKSKDELRDILIELSSPLTGYLGRIKEEGSDEYQFYFIREMPEIDSQSS